MTGNISESESQNSAAQNKVLFVGGIPGHYRSSDVVREFSRYGQVTRALVPRDPARPEANLGYSIITFAEVESKHLVLDTPVVVVGDRRVTCREYLRGSARFEDTNSQASRKLVVKFVPGWLNEEAFRKYFEQFGELELNYLVRFRNPNTTPYQNHTPGSIGYLVYKDPSVTEKMISKRYFKIETSKLQVRRFNQDYRSLKHMGTNISVNPFADYNGNDKLNYSATTNVYAQAASHRLHHVKPTSAEYSRMLARPTSQRYDDSTLENQRYRFNISEFPIQKPSQPTTIEALINCQQSGREPSGMSQDFEDKQGTHSSHPTLP